MIQKPDGDLVRLEHIADAGDGYPPFRFGFTRDWSAAAYTGPRELPDAVLTHVVTDLRLAAFREQTP